MQAFAGSAYGILEPDPPSLHLHLTKKSSVASSLLFVRLKRTAELHVHGYNRQ